MNEVLERLLVTIEGSSELLRQELRKGGTDVDQFARQTDQRLGTVENSWKKVASTMRTALGVFGVGFGATAVLNFAKGAIQAADAVGETARAAGVGAERFQRLQLVFGQNGVEAEEFGSAMRAAHTRLGQFIQTGAGPAAKAIEQLGLKQRIVNGEIRTGEQFFDAVVEALERVDNAAQRGALSAGIFGREIGAKMQATLSQGIDSLNAAADAATGIFTDETVRKADELGDAWDRIAAAAGNWAKSVAVGTAHQLGRNVGIEGLGGETPLERAARLRRSAESDEEFFPNTKDPERIARRARLRAEAAAIEEHERLLNTPFIQGGTRLPPGMRADGKPSESHEGLESDLTVGARRLTSADEVRARRRALGLRELAPDFGLQEIGVRGSAVSSADEIFAQRRGLGIKQMPNWEPLIKKAEEYHKTVEAARDRQQRFADSLAATFESRGVAALLSGKPREAIKGLGQDFAELVIRMTILQPIAERLAATLSGIGLFSGGVGKGSGFFAKLLGFSSGGRPPVGQPSWVGEGGKAELFVPDVPGRIYSHAQSMRMAGAGSGGTAIHVDARGATDPAAVEAAVERGVRAAVSIADARTDARFRAAMRPAIA